jgi:hypothetical protein
VAQVETQDLQKLIHFYKDVSLWFLSGDSKRAFV